MTAYYNEIDPYAAQWLRNLIAAGHIAPGDVDERSVVDVRPDDLRGYRQCHFFAGIGVWSYALRLATWPDDEPVWTGSCPCQPFSTAGTRGGHEDERHLWPAWFRLIRESRPNACFGEQVADGDGYAWLDDVGHDLEGIGYAIGALSPAACGFGAPHERQRLFFVADPGSARAGRDAGDASSAAPEGDSEGNQHRRHVAGGAFPCGPACELAHAERIRFGQGCADASRRHEGAQPQGIRFGSADDGGSSLAYAGSEGSQEQRWRRLESKGSPTAGFWRYADWLPCRDGKARAVEPGTFPLAHGATARVGRLRAYGNAIVAQVAAEFIRAYQDLMRCKALHSE